MFQLRILIWTTLQPNSTTTSSATNTTSYDNTQHVSSSSQTLVKQHFLRLVKVPVIIAHWLRYQPLSTHARGRDTGGLGMLN